MPSALSPFNKPFMQIVCADKTGITPAARGIAKLSRKAETVPDSDSPSNDTAIVERIDGRGRSAREQGNADQPRSLIPGPVYVGICCSLSGTWTT